MGNKSLVYKAFSIKFAFEKCHYSRKCFVSSQLNNEVCHKYGEWKWPLFTLDLAEGFKKKIILVEIRLKLTAQTTGFAINVESDGKRISSLISFELLILL